ncbi:hypothetical protein [Bacillus sp. V5-8f]|uniref:hypothetical protein n=1 Tax=Bacillus sp. V5-8f TaxID=2053044 RepID=UPI0015E09870|nr:hypothetical protein [Bacillus sp. V5-8f]
MGKDKQFLDSTKGNEESQHMGKGVARNTRIIHGTPDPRGKNGPQIDSDIKDYD